MQSLDHPECGYAETDPTGRYGRLKKILGRGDTKVVYRAFDEVLGMEVAWNQVKLDNIFRFQDDIPRLYSEVHILSNLNHDSVIKLYTSWVNKERRTFNFITEMFTSSTLRKYRQKYKRVDIRAVKNWARQILDGLVYLHGQDPPVIHRDLRCDNIFVNGHTTQVKIGDLGLAGILRGSHAHSCIGTPEFMAPELYDEEYNELVDIYSFGMCVLEMLTSEYPYTECSTVAQIYKKVTSGKLPEAFYRIPDEEARRFVGKCLEDASRRPTAKELLQDPFLAFEERDLSNFPELGVHKALHIDNALKDLICVVLLTLDRQTSGEMTIKGNLDAEDDTIFLKVKIDNKNGVIRTIHFPFDIVSDTSIDVATEMVRELEITDRQPLEIAEMIDREISALVPQWKASEQDQADSFSFHDDDVDDHDRLHHPFYSISSSSSSQSSFADLIASNGGQLSQDGYRIGSSDWLPDELLNDDEASLQCSHSSEKISNINYNSCNEDAYDQGFQARDSHQQTSRTHS